MEVLRLFQGVLIWR